MLGGGGLPRGLGHNLLMQFSSLGSTREGGKKIRAWKKFSRGVGVPGLAREKKLSQYFHSIWNFFFARCRRKISCGKLVNVAALQFVTLLTMNDFNLFSCICGYCALSCGVEERLFVRGGLL